MSLHIGTSFHLTCLFFKLNQNLLIVKKRPKIYEKLAKLYAFKKSPDFMQFMILFYDEAPKMAP